MLRTSSLTDKGFPVLVEPSSAVLRKKGDLLNLIRENAASIERDRLRHGGVLFRGFEIRGSEDFQECALALGGELRPYVSGNSPRQKVTRHVYTSTEYPSEQTISLHNEMSYARSWPAKLFFFCQNPARQGGETPLADSRHLLARLDPQLVRRFVERRVRYTQNLHNGGGFGKSWQETFETNEPSTVERYLRENDVQYRWTPTGLRTIQVRDAVAVHPTTGEQVWFNQADQWHPTNLPGELHRMLREILDEEELPHNACYGDGTPIDTDDLSLIRTTAAEEAISFSWQRSDLLMIDNMILCHGRQPFQGARSVLVAMS